MSVLKLHAARSYLWLFAVYAALFIGGCVLCEVFGHPNWGIITLPAFMTLLLVCELRSGLSLDSWWRASYRRDQWQYRATVAFHSLGVVLFSVMAYLFLQFV